MTYTVDLTNSTGLSVAILVFSDALSLGATFASAPSGMLVGDVVG